MDELQKYQEELKRAESAYVEAKDSKSRESLSLLISDLKELIQLSKDFTQSTDANEKGVPNSAPGTADSSKVSWKIGDVIEAKYATDGLYYPAIIQMISADREIYTIEYKGYNETARLSLKDIRSLRESGDKKRVHESENENRPSKMKKAPPPPPASTISWKQFSANADKFKLARKDAASSVPNNRTMTDYTKRSKHSFSSDK